MSVNRWRALGVKDSDKIGIQMAADFQRRAEAAGWSPGQIEHTIRLVAHNDERWGQMEPADALAEYEAGVSHMLPENNLAFSLDWFGGYMEHGADGGPQQSSDERAARLRQLDEMSKDASPDSPYYNGPDSKRLQAEHEALIAGDMEINEVQFERAAGEATEVTDGDYSDNAFEDNAAEGAADFGEANYDE